MNRQRRPRVLAVLFGWVVLAALLLVGCGAGSGGSPSVGAGQPHTDPFAEVDAAMSQMADAAAAWHAPHDLTVDDTAKVGLSLGDSAQLTSKIDQTLGRLPIIEAGSLRVGTDVTAVLEADPADASITPSGGVNVSTGSNVALLWEWTVRPLHPTDDLKLTAHLSMAVPGTNHVIGDDLALDIPVQRTVGYTFGQVFTNWATLSAIVASAVGAVAWLRHRIRDAGGAPSR